MIVQQEERADEASSRLQNSADLAEVSIGRGWSQVREERRSEYEVDGPARARKHEVLRSDLPSRVVVLVSHVNQRESEVGMHSFDRSAAPV